MSVRYLVAQQLGSALILPYADLDRLGKPCGSARLYGVGEIILNPCSKHQQAFIPKRTTHAIIVSDESTDCATGYCRCELCGEPIDFWDHYCKWCGAEVEQ